MIWKTYLAHNLIESTEEIKRCVTLLHEIAHIYGDTTTVHAKFYRVRLRTL